MIAMLGAVDFLLFSRLGPVIFLFRGLLFSADFPLSR
jgi:hypothetical protein